MKSTRLFAAFVALTALCVGPLASAQKAKHSAAWYRTHSKHSAAWYRTHSKHSAAWYKKHKKS